MRLFGALYERALSWARAPRALAYLGTLSFVEAFIFPLPPEVMLAPMMLARRAKAFFYANFSLACSLAGALVGYLLGHWAFHALKPALEVLHVLASIEQGVATLGAQMAGHPWGMYGVLILAALQPVVPMKFVTWACGILGVPVLPFLACIGLGRGKRVWLLALMIRLFGERAEHLIQHHAERVGWGVLIALAAVFVGWLAFR